MPGALLYTLYGPLERQRHVVMLPGHNKTAHIVKTPQPGLGNTAAATILMLLATLIASVATYNSLGVVTSTTVPAPTAFDFELSRGRYAMCYNNLGVELTGLRADKQVVHDDVYAGARALSKVQLCLQCEHHLNSLISLE